MSLVPILVWNSYLQKKYAPTFEVARASACMTWLPINFDSYSKWCFYDLGDSSIFHLLFYLKAVLGSVCSTMIGVAPINNKIHEADTLKISRSTEVLFYTQYFYWIFDGKLLVLRCFSNGKFEITILLLYDQTNVNPILNN